MMACFSEVEILIQVAVKPLQSSDPMGAVENQLRSSLFKYNEKVCGIPMAYIDILFPNDREYAKIIGDQPWLHVSVLTKLIVFRPEIGLKLQGKVNKLSDNHLSILVFGMFNASITSNEMSKQYKYCSVSNSWQSKNGDIHDEDMVEFTISSVQQCNGVLNITGAL